MHELFARQKPGSSKQQAVAETGSRTDRSSVGF